MASFFESPILNSPYEYPSRHWELQEDGQPTQRIIEGRRQFSFITPIPKPRKNRQDQDELVFAEAASKLRTDDQQYDLTQVIGDLRHQVDLWRNVPDPSKWRVTSATIRLLQHWRQQQHEGFRPFFCQIEAAETVIWLTEVAPKLRKTGHRFLDHLRDANQAANPGLSRLALKLATGTGKTTVMAMLIVWQTINSVRHPTNRHFTRGFLIVTPGITIRDRLRVLQPNDPDSYYRNFRLAPDDMLGDLDRAKIVITNYHAFKPREKIKVSKGGRALLQGRGPELHSLETTGQIIQRVMPQLRGVRNLMVFNDEAHHCYREKPDLTNESDLRGEERKDIEKKREAARLWMSGLEAVGEKLSLSRIIDLSATPFFLRGSGFAEGTLFPWTVYDFSLMDAIECGIVKLPRVPVADNVASGEMPKFRDLWKHIGQEMPKKGRAKSSRLDPLEIPTTLQTALQALYGHYKKTFECWQQAGVGIPPCFIVICNNTSTSKLIYDYIAGFYRINSDGTNTLENGQLELFRNYSEDGEPIVRPRTLLIDSEQLESDHILDPNFRKLAADEIARFRSEIVRRTSDHKRAENLTDQEVLREVMNTVGKAGRLGAETRCVVSVSMLTEGWDTNTVTHILGVRAFGTQLLCEQAIGRALRRQSYDLNSDGRLSVEYADIFGIPFDFAASPVIAPPQLPRSVTQIHSVRPERDRLEIRFPRVAGYHIELPEERLQASFDQDSTLVITPELVGPTITVNEGIIGEGVDLDLIHTRKIRRSTLLYHLTKRLIERKWRDKNEQPKYYLFGQLKRITRQWLDNHLICKGNTYPAQLMYPELADMACERITNAIIGCHLSERSVKAVLDPYNRYGTTNDVHFVTSKMNLWKTSSRHCHFNYAVCDSDWEAEFCRVVESHPKVYAYVKNQGLGLEVPYRHRNVVRKYIPDFVVVLNKRVDNDVPVYLIVEIKGYRGEDAKDKKKTMETYWIPGINNLNAWGWWLFTEINDPYIMKDKFDTIVSDELDRHYYQCRSTGEREAVQYLSQIGGSAPGLKYIPRRRSEPVK